MLRTSLLLTAAAMLTACMPSTKVPVETLFYQNGTAEQTDCLVVFIPGRGDRVGDFERTGIISAAQRVGLKADIVATDLHIGYYFNKSVMHRLNKDVVVPFRKKGYTKIWLVGISMGGMGAIFHEKNYPGLVSGIVLMAPFLGEDDILDEVEEAGGVLAWKQTVPDGENYEQDLWAWVSNYARGEASPQVYLAYGRQDRFARGSRLLETVLTPDHVFAMDGVHLWSTWLKLWEEILNHGILCNGN